MVDRLPNEIERERVGGRERIERTRVEREKEKEGKRLLSVQQDVEPPGTSMLVSNSRHQLSLHIVHTDLTFI